MKLASLAGWCCCCRCCCFNQRYLLLRFPTHSTLSLSPSLLQHHQPVRHLFVPPSPAHLCPLALHTSRHLTYTLTLLPCFVLEPTAVWFYCSALSRSPLSPARFSFRLPALVRIAALPCPSRAVITILHIDRPNDSSPTTRPDPRPVVLLLVLPTLALRPLRLSRDSSCSSIFRYFVDLRHSTPFRFIFPAACTTRPQRLSSPRLRVPPTNSSTAVLRTPDNNPLLLRQPAVD